MKDVTLILQRIQAGQAGASEDLFPAVYDELRRLAAAKMNLERADHTLCATALVHEAFVRLVKGDLIDHFESRAHFFATAAEAMRRNLVEHARRHLAAKRGGSMKRAVESDDLADLPTDPARLIDLSEAVDRLAEAGRLLGFSRKVVYRHGDYIHSRPAVHVGNLRPSLHEISAGGATDKGTGISCELLLYPICQSFGGRTSQSQTGRPPASRQRPSDYGPTIEAGDFPNKLPGRWINILNRCQRPITSVLH